MKASVVFALLAVLGGPTVAAQPPAPFVSTLGGSSIDQAWSVATTPDGGAWIAGLTYSSDFQCTGGFRGGNTDAFAARFASDGSLLWCTVLGGSSSDGTVPPQAPAIAGDSTGAVWVTGSTASTDFPTAGGGAACAAGSHIFVAKLDSLGGLAFAGCVGGADEGGGSGIAVDARDHPWVTGSVSSGAGGSAFLLELDQAGALQTWAQFGGSNVDRGLAVAVAPSGRVFVAGETSSHDFPTSDGSACVISPGGACYDGFLRAFDGAGSGTLSSVFSTLFGTDAWDLVRSLSVDLAGRAVVGGNTYLYGQPEDGFVAGFDASGVARFVTWLSGEGRDWVNAVAADARGRVWVGGYSNSFTLFRYHPPLPNGNFAFLTRLNASGEGFWCTQRFHQDVGVSLTGAAAEGTGAVLLAGIGGRAPAPSANAWLARVVDDGPPSLSVALTPSSIDAVNHKMQPIAATITAGPDYCDPDPPAITLVSVTSSEPDDGTGDGDTAGDIEDAEVGTDDRAFSVRAERAGAGNGRTYTVTYRATDSAGYTQDASATVVVRAK